MKRITAVLNESDAMTARNAVCVAGGECIVIAPLPYRICGVEMSDIYSENRAAEPDRYVRLDVTTGDGRSSSDFSAIRKIVDGGKIALALHNRGPLRRAA